MNSIYIQAHRSNSFSRLAIILVIGMVLNIIGIWIVDRQFHFLQSISELSSILYIPLFVLLLLPTIIVFFLFNTGISKKYEIGFDENGFHFNLNKKHNGVKYFVWKEITGYRFIDFEDNHYFAFEVNSVKSDFILHRNKYDFDSFLEIFLKQTALPINKE